MSELSREEREKLARRKFLENQAREKFRARQAKLDEDKEAEENTGVNALRTFGQGLSFGFGDELAGGARALLSGDWDSIDTFKDSYASFRDDERAQIARFSEDHPFAAFMAEMGGGVLTGGMGLARGLAKAGLKEVAKGATTSGAAGRGAIEGGLYGVGSAEGDGLDQLKNAGFESVLGAGLGGGLTKLGDAISKRRIVDQDLVDPETGEFTPLHLAADEESSVGSFYRSVLGKGLFGGRLLRDQQRPAVSKANADVDDIVDEQDFRRIEADIDIEDARARADDLKDQSNGIKEELESANRRIDDEVEVAELRREVADADELARIDDDLQRSTDTIEREFRELAGLEGLPPHARALLDDVDLNDPKSVNDVLADFYDNKAFMDVKGQSFKFDGEIGEMISRVLDSNPDLAIEFNDSLIPYLQRVQKRLEESGSPGTQIVPEDYIKEMLTSGEYMIDGEALMAIRNLFAKNSGGKAAYASRQIKDVFDDYIIKSLDDDAAARFIQDKDFYTNFLSYNKALQATNKQGNYLFTPDQYASAAQTTQIGKVKRNDYPLEGDYVNAINAKNSRSAEAKLGIKKLKKAQKKAKSSAKQESKQRSRDVKDGASARINRLKEVGQEKTRAAAKNKREVRRDIARSRAPGGEYRAAIDRLKTINKKKVEDTSIATSLNVDRYTGELLAPKGSDVPRLSIAGIGGTATSPLATKGAQKLITGQTGAQKLLADQLRRGNAQKVGRAATRPFYIDEEDNR